MRRPCIRFNDPLLSSLVGRIAAQNLDLQTAAERVLQARAQRQVVASQGLPQVNGRSSLGHTRISPTGNPGAIVVAKPGAPLGFDVFENGLDASWDLDLFGRVRREVEAAGADTQAAVEDRRGVALAALADLAQDYLQLRGAQAALRAARQRYAEGVVDFLDVNAAQAQLLQSQNDLASSRTQIATGLVTLYRALGGGWEIADAAGPPGR